MPQLAAQQPPPADYYADNVRYLLTYVRDYHSDLVSGLEQQFIDALTQASVQAQRLFARLLSRKGPWIRIDKLHYPEIVSIEHSLRELTERSIVEINCPAPADILLGLLTQAERVALFPPVTGSDRARWIESCVTRYPDQAIRVRLGHAYPWVCLRHLQAIRICQLLFFGDDHQDMSTFVLQDLGLLRYEQYPLNPSERMFQNPKHLQGYLYFRRLHHLSHRVAENQELAQWLSQALWLRADTRQEQRQKDRTLNRLGHWHERRGEFDRALECYARSSAHPGRERRARLLARLEDQTGVELLLARIAQAPRCAEEEDFAERFQQRTNRKRIPTTELQLRATLEGRVEAHAASLLSANGGSAWHLENQFPLAIAGLAYWGVVFAPLPGAFVNPFQTGPVDLFWPDFAQTRKALIKAQHERLADPAFFVETLRATYTEKQGIANRLVSWRHFNEEILEAVLAHVAHATLLKLADYVINNLGRARTGFPDLFVIYGKGQFEFVEVKGPTDQLQPGQRIWFKLFRQLRLPARVLKFKAHSPAANLRE